MKTSARLPISKIIPLHDMKLSFHWTKKTITLLFSACLLLGILTYTYHISASPTGGIEFDLYSRPKTLSYTIYNVGETYLALSTTTGKIEYGGTDASVVMQSAINVGGTIFVRDGVYPLKTGLLIRRSNVELIAESRNTVLTSNVSDITMIDVGAGTSTYSNIVIKGFKIDGGGTIGYGILFRYGITDSLIEDNEVIGCNIGINLDNTAYRNTIRRNYIHSSNSESIGIEIYRSDYNIVKENYIVGLGGSVGGRGINLEEAKGNIIEGNVVRSSVRGTSFGDGINLLTNAVGNTIANNEISSNQGYGINFEGALGDAHSNELIGNHVKANGKVGIFIGSSTHNHVEGGIVEGNGEQGIVLYGQSNWTSIFGVVVKNNTKGGIYLYQSSHCTFDSLILHNNTQGADLRYKEIKTDGSGTRFSSHNIFRNLKVVSDNPSKRAEYLYGDEQTRNDYNYIYDCYFSKLPGTNYLNVLGSNSEVKYNIGYVTENSGTATGTSPIVVEHGLAGTPTVVTLGVKSVQPYSVSWIANSTHIIIYHSATRSITVTWYAEYNP